MNGVLVINIVTLTRISAACLIHKWTSIQPRNQCGVRSIPSFLPVNDSNPFCPKWVELQFSCLLMSLRHSLAWTKTKHLKELKRYSVGFEWQVLLVPKQQLLSSSQKLLIFPQINKCWLLLLCMGNSFCSLKPSNHHLSAVLVWKVSEINPIPSNIVVYLYDTYSMKTKHYNVLCKDKRKNTMWDH